LKYSEFKTEVEKMGLDVDANERIVFARRKSGSNVIAVYKSMENYVDCGWSSYIDTMTDEQRGDLFDLAYQLAKTPLAEREEEKRYWLQKIPVPLLDKEGEKKWLWKYTGMALSNVFGADTIKIDSKLYKTIFTESEIAEMDITGFEKEPVE